MSGVGLFGAAVVALLAGWIAGLALNRRPGLFSCLMAGLAGGLLGAALMRLFDIPWVAGWLSSLVVSTAGAIILIALADMIGRRRGRARRRLLWKRPNRITRGLPASDNDEGTRQ